MIKGILGTRMTSANACSVKLIYIDLLQTETVVQLRDFVMPGGFDDDVARQFIKDTEKINFRRSNLVRSYNRRNLWVLLGASGLALFTCILCLKSLVVSD